MNLRPTVLFIEDEPDIREVVTQALRGHYNVIGMPDGLSAWEALEGGLRPDVVILDLHLAGMTGYRLIAMIRDSDDLTHMPIVLLSGDVLLDDVAAALRIDEYLAKPVDLHQLRRVVASAIGL